jgi:hypothetical protein
VYLDSPTIEYQQRRCAAHYLIHYQRSLKVVSKWINSFEVRLNFNLKPKPKSLMVRSIRFETRLRFSEFASVAIMARIFKSMQRSWEYHL